MPSIARPSSARNDSTPTWLERLVERGFGSGATLHRQPVPGALPYLIVSGASGPRWLLPASPTAADLATVGVWRPYDRPGRLKWHGLVAAWRLGVAGRLPNVRRAWIAGADPLPPPLVQIGTADSRRKAVLVRTGTRRPAVRKIALTDDADAALAHEAAVLRQLARLRPGLAPALLDAAPGSIGIEWVAGTGVPARLDETILGGLVALGLGEPVETRGVEGLPERLPGFIVHGDLAPWNVRRQEDRIRLIDWEDAEIPGLPLQDLLGWCLAVGHVLGRRPIIEILRRERPVLETFAARVGVAPAVVQPLVRFHLDRRRRLALDRGDRHYADALAAALAVPTIWP